jgi:hypothetical protein
MGGRFAMREALANPDRVAALILESTHPGIESEIEREARRQRDATLATSLVEDYDRFLATWNRLPLFASPSDAPSEPREHFEAIQRSQVPSRMARSLIEHGAGTMMPVRDRLHTLPMPVLAITGALDRTYPQFRYTHPTAIFQSGWTVLPSKRSTPAHSYWKPSGLFMSLEERSDGDGTIEAFIDWDETTVVSEIDSVPLYNPEGGTIAYYSGAGEDPDDPAVYGTDVWRKRRVFTLKESLDTGTTEALSVKLESSSPMCLMTMDVHGSYINIGGGRTPQEG